MTQPIKESPATVSNIFYRAKNQGKWIAVRNGALTLVDKPGLWAWICFKFRGTPIVRPEGATREEIGAHIVSVLQDTPRSSENNICFVNVVRRLEGWKADWSKLLPGVSTAIKTWRTNYQIQNQLHYYDKRITLEEHNNFMAIPPEGWNPPKGWDPFSLVARRLATDHALTDYGMDWSRLKAICSAKDYSDFASGRVQLACIPGSKSGSFVVQDFRHAYGNQSKRTLLSQEWVRNEALKATGEAYFLQRAGLPPIAKTIDAPSKIISKGLQQWKELLELGLTYDDLKHFQAEGMAPFLTMSAPLSAEAMEQCKALHAYLSQRSTEDRKEITASPEHLKEAIRGQNRTNLTLIYGSTHSDFDEGLFQNYIRSMLEQHKQGCTDRILDGSYLLSDSEVRAIQARVDEAKKRIRESRALALSSMQAAWLIAGKPFENFSFEAILKAIGMEGKNPEELDLSSAEQIDQLAEKLRLSPNE